MNTPLGSIANRMGFESGFLVLESGYGDDSDETLRQDVMRATGSPFISGHVQEVVDGVLLWWREDDGDLVDALVDTEKIRSVQDAIDYIEKHAKKS